MLIFFEYFRKRSFKHPKREELAVPDDTNHKLIVKIQKLTLIFPLNAQEATTRPTLLNRTRLMPKLPRTRRRRARFKRVDACALVATVEGKRRTRGA